MKIFMIGGTGLIGSKVAEKLILDNHQVITLVQTPLSKEENVLKGMEIVYANYLTISDNELFKLMDGADAFIFAAGIDERIEAKRPIYELFKKHNVDGLKRILKISRKTSIKNVVICGSYFTYFARKWTHLNLDKSHPYIKTRLEQREMALKFSSKDFNVAVIELPYIFGIQKNRKPVWVFLVQIIKRMKFATFFPKGGTTMITVKQAAEAVVGALYKNKGANSYPIGYYNLSWKEFLTIVHQAMGYKNRKIITISKFTFTLVGIYMDLKRKFKGVEGGLKMRKYAKLQTTNLFIDKEEGALFLGVKEDDINKAISDSILLSMDVIENKIENIKEMKSE